MKVWWCPLCRTSDNYKTKKLLIIHMMMDHKKGDMIDFIIDTGSDNPYEIDKSEGYTNKNVAT